MTSQNDQPAAPTPGPSPARSLASTLKDDLRRAMTSRIAADQLPYEGQWLPRAVVEERIRADRRKARVRAIELLLLFALCTGLSLILVEMLRGLAY